MFRGDGLHCTEDARALATRRWTELGVRDQGSGMGGIGDSSLWLIRARSASEGQVAQRPRPQASKVLDGDCRASRSEERDRHSPARPVPRLRFGLGKAATPRMARTVRGVAGLLFVVGVYRFICIRKPYTIETSCWFLPPGSTIPCRSGETCSQGAISML